jgi:hypothetical protein
MNTELVDELYVPTVDRVAEIAVATERLEDLLRGRTVPDSVLFYYGVPTVGKSRILREIRNYAVRKGVATAWIDFDSSATLNRSKGEYFAGSAGRLRIIEQLLRDLSRTSNFTSGTIDVSDLGSDTLDDAVERLLAFVHDLSGLRQGKPLALFFDTVEESNIDTFLWLQQHILEPLISSIAILVVMAGRTQPNTIVRDLIYPLERRTFKVALEPFNDEQTEDQIGAIGAGELHGQGIKLIDFTGGLPGLNDAAIRWMVGQDLYEPNDALRRHLVIELIFEKRLAWVDAQLRDRLLAVSPLRQFDSGLLRVIARDLFDPHYGSSGISAIRELLRSLQETRLVEPHPDGYGYVVPPYLRPMLDSYLQQKNIEEHFEVHRIAAHYFAEQVEQKDWVAITNRLYHLGGIHRDLDRAPTVLQEQLRAKLPSDLQFQPADPQILLHELKSALERLFLGGQTDRAFDLTTKIRRVLNETEFDIVLDAEVRDKLVATCGEYIDGS